MPSPGARISFTDLSQTQRRRAVLKALQAWHEPSRKEMRLFIQLKIAEKHGFNKNLPIVEARFALNAMLAFYIEQLGRLRPDLATLLLERFREMETIKQIALRRHKSKDQMNNLQREAVGYLAELIYDDEVLSNS